MQGKSWYFRRKGRVEGPFSLEQIQKRVGTNPEFAVWNSKLTSWKPAGDWLQSFQSEAPAQQDAPGSQGAVSINSKTENSSNHKEQESSSRQSKHVTTKDTSSLVAEKAQDSRYSNTAAELRAFRDKWAALEKKQLAERQALLQEFSELKQEISSLKKSSINSTLAQMKDEKSDKTTSSTAQIKKVEQSARTILKSQNLTVKGSPAQEDKKPMGLELVDDSVDKQEKIYPWPSEQVQHSKLDNKPLTASSQRKVETLQKSLHRLSEEQKSVAEPAESSTNEVGDIDMMRRVVARRRRRRVR